MDIVANQKQISESEKDQINEQVKAELIDHLYRGCLPGTITGMVASVALFIDYYGFTPTHLLITWMIFFNFMMVSLSCLYFLYLRYKPAFTLRSWELAYSIMFSGCAFSWVPIIYLLPDDTTRQYLALLAYFMATTGYATGTIGHFGLCVTTLNIMLLPLVIWSFIEGGIFYNIIATYSLIYMAFMMGINHRSTQWFKASLKLKLENTLVSYQANHDLLTDLPNQRLLPQFIASAIAFAQQGNNTFALVSFSLNRMEVINDSLGHHAGNYIIKAVANRLQTLSDNAAKNPEQTQYIITISRTDTFNVIVVPITKEEADAKIKLLFSIFDEPFFVADKRIKMTASAGASIYPHDGSDEQSLLINADAAALQAKQAGGNRLEFYRSEINAEMTKQIEMEHDLNDAIINNEFTLHYQPLVDLKTGRVVGAEALIRWIHPVHGFISPIKFIPLAEETGLILPIGEWVLKEALRQTKIWHKMGFEALRISVNMAGKQLRQENIVETVKQALIEAHFDPAQLEIELTETAILDENVTAIIKKFKELGVSLAVDDFGTGYSGLSYLKRFSIDKLKIDQSFIRDIPSNNDSMTIVSAILAMSRELKIDSLAEGVETEEQLKFLRTKGCDYMQGYYFSKPLEPTYFTQLLLSDRNLPSNMTKMELSK